jgi:hypothetical protein
VAYVEHHRTLGDWVAVLVGTGFRIVALLEPEWPRGTNVSGAAGRACAGADAGTAVFAAVLDR